MQASSLPTSDSSVDRKNRNSLNLKRLQDLAERGGFEPPIEVLAPITV
jgi:hypothetical protein